MKTTALILMAILWISSIAQNQKIQSQGLVPRVKIVHEKGTKHVNNSHEESPASVSLPLTTEGTQALPLTPEENRQLLEEMLAWYEFQEANPWLLKPEQKYLLEKQLSSIIREVMKDEMEIVKKRYNIAQRWCDSLTRIMGMPSEICMEILKRSKAGYLSVRQMMQEMNDARHPKAMLGMMENVLDKMNQVLLMQETAILEIHQYRKADAAPAEIMAADSE